MIILILYALSFPVNLYSNYFAGMSRVQKALIASMPIFHLFHLGINLSGIAGIFFLFGWQSALGAFIVSWTFHKLTYRFFFRRCVLRTAHMLFESNWFEPDSTPAERTQKAHESAEQITWDNARGVGT